MTELFIFWKVWSRDWRLRFITAEEMDVNVGIRRGNTEMVTEGKRVQEGFEGICLGGWKVDSRANHGDSRTYDLVLSLWLIDTQRTLAA